MEARHVAGSARVRPLAAFVDTQQQAQLLKEEGNALYKVGEIQKALECYTQ